MISLASKWVFIHPPKSAGTSVLEALLPFSDDRKAPTVKGEEDFAIVGPVTLKKHLPLRYFAGVLEERIDEFTVIGGARHPLTRDLSHFFYKRRARRQRFALPPLDAAEIWDEQEFLSLVVTQPSLSDFYRLPSGAVRVPDVRVDKENVGGAIPALARAVGATELRVPHFNAGPADEFVKVLERSRGLAELVASHRAEDYATFGYDLMPDC